MTSTKTWGQAGDLRGLEHLNIALLQDFAVSSPAKRAQGFVHNDIGSIACLKLHLVVIAILSKAVVVVVLLSVVAGLHLSVMAARLHLELLGIIEAGVLQDEVTEVDLHLILMVREVVLCVPEIFLNTKLELDGIVIDKFLIKDITIWNDTMVTSVTSGSLRHRRWRM